MPADLRIRISPVIRNFADDQTSAIRRAFGTVAVILIAQTTYHARSRRDLQREPSIRGSCLWIAAHDHNVGAFARVLSVSGGQKLRRFARRKFAEARLPVKRSEPAIRNAVARLRRRDGVDQATEQGTPNAASPHVAANPHPAQHQHSLFPGEPNDSDNFARVFCDKKLVAAGNLPRISLAF
jgi:hypothetical protein